MAGRRLSCPQGHANPVDERYCRQCGTPLEGTPPEASKPGNVVDNDGRSVPPTKQGDQAGARQGRQFRDVWKEWGFYVVLLVVSLIVFGAVGRSMYLAFLSDNDRSASTTPTSTTPPPTTTIPEGDDLFLQTIKRHIFGIDRRGSDPKLIDFGHYLCLELEKGRSRASLHDYLSAREWSDSDASWLITASVASYCPYAG